MGPTSTRLPHTTVDTRRSGQYLCAYSRRDPGGPLGGRARKLEARHEWPVLLLLVPYVWLVHRFWFLCDDAYITFRYSKNLLQ